MFSDIDFRCTSLQLLFGSEMGSVRYITLYIVPLGSGLRNSLDMSNSKEKFVDRQGESSLQEMKNIDALKPFLLKNTLNGEHLTSERLCIFYV